MRRNGNFPRESFDKYFLKTFQVIFRGKFGKMQEKSIPGANPTTFEFMFYSYNASVVVG
jgi:hypothetical protein